MVEEVAVSLGKRLAALELLEAEMIRKAQAMVPAKSSLTVIDYFLLGALKRTVSQSSAFRKLVESWNFSSAAVMTRTQLDTAMRVNGLRFMKDREADVAQIFNGTKLYKHIESVDGKKMLDNYLKEKLSEDHDWVSDLYGELSDFVHLSFRHFWPSMVGTDDENRIATFVISAEDPQKDERNYYELTDAFFKVTRITGTMLAGFLMARHSPPRQETSRGGE